eukprot:m.100129 g.100129  ORF g.100129 m.100129 type:complete len:566 (-) comp15614_c0_seq2:358-2055(-)
MAASASATAASAACLLVAVLAAVCVWVPVAEAAVSEAPYVPTSRVKLYHKDDFDNDVSYYTDVGERRAAPFIIIGLLFFFGLMFWSFGRLCCRRCCGCRQPRAPEGAQRVFFAIVGFLMACACAALLFYGLAAEKRQSDTMGQVPELIDNVIDFKNDAIAQLQNITNTCTLMKAEVDSLDNDIKTEFASEISEFKSAVDSAITSVNDIISTLNSTNIENIQSDFGDKTDKYNDDRHKAVIGTLGLLIGVLLLRLLLMFLNGHGPTCLRPSKSIPCKILSQFLTIVILLLILLTWIISGILLFGSTVSADFCINADVNIIDVANLQNKSEVIFFLQCDETNSVNPFTNTTVTSQLFSGLNQAKTNITDMQTQLATLCAGGPPPTPAQCNSTNVTLTIISGQITGLNTSLGIDANSDTNFESGVLSLANCTNLNGKYQAVLNVVCGTFFDALTKFFETFAAFACMFVMLEILKRRYPSALGEDDFYSDDERSPYVPGASTEISKYDVNKDTEMNMYPNPPPYNQPPPMNDIDGPQMYPDQSAGYNYPEKGGNMYPDLNDDQYAQPRY